MIKNFETYINEDYFSKLANRKDNGDVRKENEITEELVLSIIDSTYKGLKSITIRKDGNKTVVDVDGTIYLKKDIEEIPFQFGTVTGDFNCHHCNLTSLKGCPQKVGGNFYCYDCENLTSLEGCPEEVDTNANFSWCENLTSLEGCPKEVGGSIIFAKCGKRFTHDEIKSVCNVKGTIDVL